MQNQCNLQSKLSHSLVDTKTGQPTHQITTIGDINKFILSSHHSTKGS